MLQLEFATDQESVTFDLADADEHNIQDVKDVVYPDFKI